MKYEESKLQQACVGWFRGEYPEYAMLLTHPINEGSGHADIDRKRQGIHKKEGAVAGVADLILFMSAEYQEPGMTKIYRYHALGIEMKTSKGRQSQEQKDFQQMFQAAGYKYAVVRSIEEFMTLVNDYIAHVEEWRMRLIKSTHAEIIKAAENREKEKFNKIVGRK